LLGKTVVWVGLACAAAACEDGGTTAQKDTAKTDVSDIWLPDIGGDSGASDSAQATDGVIASDTGDGSDIEPGDTDIAVDAVDAVDAGAEVTETTDAADSTGGCQNDAPCSLPGLLDCQAAKCVDGQCVAVDKPAPWCCADNSCDDGNSCTVDSCDAQTAQCQHIADLTCCAGKQVLAAFDFEASLDGLTIVDGPTNGNGSGKVGWKLSPDRKHAGATAAYFGNACKKYDTSATQDNLCQGDGNALAVSTELATTELQLPESKKSHVHFWLFLDTEPPHTQTFGAGTCAAPCPSDSSCVFFNGKNQCLPEKDLLTLEVVVGTKVTPVFVSLSIGKSTAGGWQRVAADLSPFAGKKVKLRWRFATGTGAKNGFEGVWLDDIVIETVCPAAACSTASGCSADSNACTLDTCSPYANSDTASGACLYGVAPDCCLSSADCSDNNACTTDTCTAGTCGNVPDASQPACCTPAGLVADSFESGGLTGWTAVGLNSVGVRWRALSGAGRPTVPAGPPSGAMAFANESGTSYADEGLDVDVGAKGSICTKPTKLAEGTVYNLARFWLKLDTEWSGVLPSAYVNPPIEGLAKFDELKVEVFQGGLFATVWSSDVFAGSTLTGPDPWKEVVVDLSYWAGKTVQVCLTFDAGDKQQNDYAGPAIDDFALEVACAKSDCSGPQNCPNCDDALAVPLCDEITGCSCPAP
jgi:hypothetical protein